MDILEIEGGNSLNGTMKASGAKNAALPVMCATLLSDEAIELSNLPDVADIVSMGALLISMGCEIVPLNDHCLTIQARNIDNITAPYNLVRKMRASVLSLGAVLARQGMAKISVPGGCAIGARPIDLHIRAMEDLGATITMENGYVVAQAPSKGLTGGRVTFPIVSVGASENAIMAACLSRGESIIENAACEPEIVDLVDCLRAMGADIEGEGTSTIRIQGKQILHKARHVVIADRIEVGSYLMAAAATQGKITIEDCKPSHLLVVLEILERTGCVINIDDDSITLEAPDILRAQSIVTEVYPGYPTDLQAQFMALMMRAQGISLIHESIFENRFMHVPELARLGGNIKIEGMTAVVKGLAPLQGAPMMATDLRASMSLIIAALASVGVTQIRRVYHLDRGYSRLVEKLTSLGANIVRKPDQQ